MSTVAIPLHVKTPVVDESVRTFPTRPRIGLSIWQADPPTPDHTERLDTIALPLIALAFLRAERTA